MGVAICTGEFPCIALGVVHRGGGVNRDECVAIMRWGCRAADGAAVCACAYGGRGGDGVPCGVRDCSGTGSVRTTVKRGEISQMGAIPTTVIRHVNERLSKCSLSPLEGRADITFLTAHGEMRFDATGFTVLAVGAPVLSGKDAGRPLLLLDSTWRLLPKLLRRLDGAPVFRSLPPGVVSAYPRVSKTGVDPSGGLASVEALYWARRLLGDDDLSLLENYYWRDAFLERNARAPSSITSAERDG